MKVRNQILGIELEPEESKKLESLLQANQVQVNKHEVRQFRANFNASFQKQWEIASRALSSRQLTVY